MDEVSFARFGVGRGSKRTQFRGSVVSVLASSSAGCHDLEAMKGARGIFGCISCGRAPVSYSEPRHCHRLVEASNKPITILISMEKSFASKW